MAGAFLGRNISSLLAQRSLSSSTASLSKSFERLSSGLRINQAADDAAGLSIAAQLGSGSRVYAQAVRNLNDGISAISIAEGALSSLRDITQRQLELAEQAANGSYSIGQRQALNAEANQLVREFNRITEGTKYNGLNLFDASSGAVLLQAGYGADTLQFDTSGELRRAIGDGTFSAPEVVAVEGGTMAMTNGDVNGDGKTDLITGGTSGEVLVRLGNGDGTFGSPRTLAAGGNVLSVSLGDFNNDGCLDIVSASADTLVFLGHGDGTFDAATTIVVAGTGLSVTTGDFNGDNLLDIATGANEIVVSLGRGDGTFAAGSSIGLSQIRGLSAGDFNGDGRADLVAAEYNFGSTVILLSQGDGSFQASATIAGGAYSNALPLVDLNNDGKLDLVTGGLELSTFLGRGDGTFEQCQSELTGGLMTMNLASGDFNGDGITDIAGATYWDDPLVFLGTGDGRLGEERRVQGSLSVSFQGWVMTGDLDGDGRTDLVANLDYGVGELYAFLGKGSYSTSTPYLNINTREGALAALGTLDSTLSRIEAELSSLGAALSRLGSAAETIGTQVENYRGAVARIQDVDVAEEAASAARLQIRQQVAQAVLAQANMESKLALILLEGGTS